MANKLQSREIRIGSRKYPVKLTDGEFQKAHSIENEINDRISDFQLKYEKLDHQDCVSMALISYAFELYHQVENNSGQPVTERISSIQAMLEELS